MSELQADEDEIIVEEEDIQEEEPPEQEVNPEGEEAKESEVVEDDDEITVSIGEAAPTPEEVEQAQAPAWVKELRKSHRDLQKEKRALEEKLRSLQTPQDNKVELGQKPKLEDCDYDSDKYEEAITKWYDRKRIVDEQTTKVKEKQLAEEKTWSDRRAAYDDAKTKLKVSNYEEAEHVALELFSTTQQGIILHGADNPAMVVYALGSSPAKAKELAAITDPVKYAFAIAKLETQLKVSKRVAPAPEAALSKKGSAPLSGSSDSTLERLRKDAAITGDVTKVIQYKRQLAEKTKTRN